MAFFDVADNLAGCDKHDIYNPSCTQCTINKTIIDDEIKQREDKEDKEDDA